MGKRREPRKVVEVPVRIFGTDAHGKIFSENVTALDVSQSGARLGGVRAQIKVDEIIGMTYGKSKVHFPYEMGGVNGLFERRPGRIVELEPREAVMGFPPSPGHRGRHLSLCR